jgi:hypothetical protein
LFPFCFQHQTIKETFSENFPLLSHSIYWKDGGDDDEEEILILHTQMVFLNHGFNRRIVETIEKKAV